MSHKSFLVHALWSTGIDWDSTERWTQFSTAMHNAVAWCSGEQVSIFLDRCCKICWPITNLLVIPVQWINSFLGISYVHVYEASHPYDSLRHLWLRKWSTLCSEVTLQWNSLILSYYQLCPWFEQKLFFKKLSSKQVGPIIKAGVFHTWSRKGCLLSAMSRRLRSWSLNGQRFHHGSRVWSCTWWGWWLVAALFRSSSLNFSRSIKAHELKWSWYSSPASSLPFSLHYYLFQ